MTEDIDTYEDTEYDEADIDSMSDAEFGQYLDRKYPERNKPAESPAAPSASTPQPSAPVIVPVSTERRLPELRTAIANLDQAIAAQTPTQRLTDHTEAGEKATQALSATVPLRAERQRLAMEADRLSDSIEWGFAGATDESLSLRAEDLALELEEVSNQIKAVPVEALRSEADKARYAKAERARDALLRRDAALKRERYIRRSEQDFAKYRERDIERRTDAAIAAERSKELADRIAQARTESGFSPELEGWIKTEHAKEVVTPKQRAAKRAQVAKEYDATIAQGILDYLIQQG